MKISVVIPTFNEAKYIADCLKSLAKQSLQDFEVIVVDDGSLDNTKTILPTLNIGLKLNVFSTDHKGAGAARNFGAKHATGDILVFVDADMVFERHFLKNLIRPIISSKSKGTFSRAEYVLNWENRWARCWNINEGWEEKRRHPKKYPTSQKVFRAILRKEFERVGGFTPGGYTDDYSLSDKLGYLATEAKNAFFYHSNPPTLREVYYQAKWAAKRNYKLGVLGTTISLLRSSFPLSLVIGLVKSVLNLRISFLVFKIVYDFGNFMGIFEYLYFKTGSK